MKMKKQVLISMFMILLVSVQICAQEYKEIIPKKESYGIDKEHKIIVWNFKISDSLKSINTPLKIIFDQRSNFIISSGSLSYTTSYDLNYSNKTFRLYITNLPIIKIASDNPIKDEPKIASQFTYVHEDSVTKSTAGVEFRGNISLKFPKKSFDLEFWENPEEKKSKNVQFENLREDDDWILDGLYNEPLRLRSYICNKLWLSIHQPHYQDLDKRAKSGIDMMFTEVFLDNKYIGIHTLTEQVDRKLLRIKKYKKRKIRGELFKASSYNGAPSYQKAPRYKNIFPHWAGYEIEYPFIDYKAQWKNIYRFTKFVVKSKDSIFKKNIAKKFDLDNAIDYFLFINLIRATDNLGKNFYIARYNKSMPYFNIPWDLDGVLGTIQDGKRIPTTDDILSNGLFNRLLKTNPNQYRNRLKERWFTLRENQFSNRSLLKSINQSYNYFKDNKVYERESLVWKSEITLDQHKAYMESWLTDRLSYLDSYFSKLK